MSASASNATEGETPQSRAIGVDAARVVAIFLVAILHALPTEPTDHLPLWASLTGCVARVAVPFFFVASGYFMRSTGETVDLLMGPVKRILPVYAFWYLFYVAVGGGVQTLGIKQIIAGSAAIHLWFLPALMLSLVGVGLLLRFAGLRVTGLLVTALAAYGLFSGAWHEALTGVAGTRAGMQSAPLLVFLGVLLKRYGRPQPMAKAGLLAVAALGLLIVEEFILAKLAGHALVSHNFPLGAFVFGGAAFVFALSLGEVGQLEPVARLGRYTLGVYGLHLALVWLLLDALGNASLGAVMAIALIACGASFVIVALLSRLPLARKVLT